MVVNGRCGEKRATSYTVVRKREEQLALDAEWLAALKHGKRGLSEWGSREDLAEQGKASMQAKVEHRCRKRMILVTESPPTFPEDAVYAAPSPQQCKTAPPGTLTREHRSDPRSSHSTG